MTSSSTPEGGLPGLSYVSAGDTLSASRARCSSLRLPVCTCWRQLCRIPSPGWCSDKWTAGQIPMRHSAWALEASRAAIVAFWGLVTSRMLSGLVQSRRTSGWEVPARDAYLVLFPEPAPDAVLDVQGRLRPASEQSISGATCATGSSAVVAKHGPRRVCDSASSLYRVEQSIR